MPAFRFTGGPETGGVPGVDMFGTWFPLHDAVDIDDPLVIAKLRGNRFFEEVTDGDGGAVGGAGAPETGVDPDSVGGSAIGRDGGVSLDRRRTRSAASGG